MTQQERSRKARQKWRGLISEQARSGQDVAAFCRERRLCIPHFYWWKKRLRESSPAKPAGAGRFVEVKLATKGSGLLGRAPEPRGSEEARVEIRLRNGRSVVVGREFDAGHLHALLAVVEAEQAAPEIAREAVRRIDTLFAVERQAKEVSAEELLALRQAQSVPVLAGLREKLLGWKAQLLPKHPMAEAVNYVLSQWTELHVFCTDGAVPMDNNVSEREMKRVVLHRKNSLFVGNPRGGRTAAILASLASTCRRHEVDPQLYLTQLLVNLPPLLSSVPHSRRQELDAWLPDQWKLLHATRTAALQSNPAQPTADESA